MSAPELRAQIEEIVTKISTTQYFYQKALNELNDVTRELLALDLGGSHSRHVVTANRLIPTILSEHTELTFDLSLVHSAMQQYRDEL